MSVILNGDLQLRLSKKLAELYRQVLLQKEYGFDPERLDEHLQCGIEGRWSTRLTEKVGALKNRDVLFNRPAVSSMIPATDGRKTIWKEENLFVSHETRFRGELHGEPGVSPHFKEWGLNVQEGFRPETPIESLEIAKSGISFYDYFTTLGNLYMLAMTDAQIIWVVENRPHMLTSRGESTFFLKKREDNNFFVVGIRRCEEGTLCADVEELTHTPRHNCICDRRIVGPKLWQDE